MARLPPSRHSLHCGLRIPDLRARDDSPLNRSCYQGVPAICLTRRLPAQRIRRCGPNATFRTRLQQCEGDWWPLSPRCYRVAHAARLIEFCDTVRVMNEAVLNKLERRLGRLHAKLRLGIEMDHEAQIFGQGINFFHIENWCSVHSVIRTTLKLMGLYRRGRREAAPGHGRTHHIPQTPPPDSPPRSSPPPLHALPAHTSESQAR